MIKEAAIRLGGADGQVYTGRRHSDVIRSLAIEGFHLPIQGEQGFVTMEGEFLDREEAAKVALQCGQITKLRFSNTELFSEDLY